uniref:Uncharacterized protein n=1 Tax=Avena sativa TaxID=4498 RepID=A0ACD5Z901_AVESA
MRKPANIVYAPALVSILLLVCFSIHAHRRATDDKSNEKIKLPYGLCAYKRDSPDCKSGPDRSYCYCCLVNSRCYLTLYACEEVCNEPSPSATVTPAHPPLTSQRF